MKRSWIKLYVEILDDMKLGPLPVWLKWRFVELLLVAAESDENGTLPPVTQTAWRLRVSEDDLLKSLGALREIGVVSLEGDRWKVTNFEKRQAAMTSTERVQEYRKRTGNDTETKRSVKGNETDVTDSSSSSDSESVSKEGEGPGEGEVMTAYENNIGALTPIIADKLHDDIDDYSCRWVLLAIERATKNEKRSLGYVEGILKGWKRDGITDPAKQNGKSTATADKPAINEQAVESTKQTIEQKWDFQPAPPPTTRPQITRLAKQLGKQRGKHS